MRVLLALGGNAMAGPDGQVRPEDQIAAAGVAMASVAELVARDIDVVITHGNGPQVGDMLVKNEIAASVVPPVPLDWCVAQTQATLGFVLMNNLDDALRERDVDRRTVTLVTRTLVAADDPGFAKPSKPIGHYLSQEEAALLIDRPFGIARAVVRQHGHLPAFRPGTEARASHRHEMFHDGGAVDFKEEVLVWFALLPQPLCFDLELRAGADRNHHRAVRPGVP